MRNIITILLIFLTQYTCLYIASEVDIFTDIETVEKSCVFGVDKVKMTLFTRDASNGRTVEVNELCNSINTTKPVIFMVHGFNTNSTWSNFTYFASTLLKRDYTILSLDWADGACYYDPMTINLLEYPFAVYNTREVGNYLASYIKALVACGVPLKNIKLFGHSLGAHICGFAGKHLNDLPDYDKLPLIIAFDPAGPLFRYLPCKQRLCETDAICLKILHVTSTFGIEYSEGQLNLWLYGGHIQPGCGPYGTDLDTACAHKRVDYMTYMIDNCAFLGVPTSRRTPNPFLIPSISHGCPDVNGTNCVAFDENILDTNCAITGDYCVHVTLAYPPYCTKNNFNCTE
jgi:pimeloyl-ACP methyl ester carboxylesterase